MSDSMNRWCLLLGSSILVMAFADCAADPRSYDDCILEYVKPGMTRDAVGVLMASCREKFPTPMNERSLGALELIGVTGRGGVSYGNRFNGTLYNGNDDVSITQVEIEVTATLGDKVASRVYRDGVSIPPKTAGDFGFDIILGDTGSTYSWSLQGGRGVDVK